MDLEIHVRNKEHILATNRWEMVMCQRELEEAERRLIRQLEWEQQHNKAEIDPMLTGVRMVKAQHEKYAQLALSTI